MGIHMKHCKFNVDVQSTFHNYNEYLIHINDKEEITSNPRQVLTFALKPSIGWLFTATSPRYCELWTLGCEAPEMTMREQEAGGAWRTKCRNHQVWWREGEVSTLVRVPMEFASSCRSHFMPDLCFYDSFISLVALLSNISTYRISTLPVWVVSFDGQMGLFQFPLLLAQIYIAIFPPLKAYVYVSFSFLLSHLSIWPLNIC